MSAFAFRVDASIAESKAKIGKIRADIENKVTLQAINRAASTVQSRVVKKLAEETGLQQKAIRQKVSLSKAGRRSGGDVRWYAIVGASRYTVNLIDMVKTSQRKVNFFNKKIGKGKNARFRSPGVVAKAWGKDKTYKGTFIGTNSKGELKVFARIGHDRNRLKLISGPSLRNEFKKPEMFEFMRSIAAERFPIEFQAALKYAMSKYQ